MSLWREDSPQDTTKYTKTGRIHFWINVRQGLAFLKKIYLFLDIFKDFFHNKTGDKKKRRRGTNIQVPEF